MFWGVLEVCFGNAPSQWRARADFGQIHRSEVLYRGEL